MPTVSVFGDLRIGQPLTLNYANFSAEPTGPVTVSDGLNTVTLTGSTLDYNAGVGTFVTEAYPALPAAGNTVTPFNVPGLVTVSLTDPGV